MTEFKNLEEFKAAKGKSLGSSEWLTVTQEMVNDFAKATLENYGLNKVRFAHPVPCGSRVRAHVTLADVEDYGDNGVKSTWQATIEIEGVEKPACIAEFLSLAFE